MGCWLYFCGNVHWNGAISRHQRRDGSVGSNFLDSRSAESEQMAGCFEPAAFYSQPFRAVSGDSLDRGAFCAVEAGQWPDFVDAIFTAEPRRSDFRRSGNGASIFRQFTPGNSQLAAYLVDFCSARIATLDPVIFFFQYKNPVRLFVHFLNFKQRK